jgi:lipopolysaccharide/colanic/teichoic acid biosynthesis glycosyltransferase
MYRNFFKRLIDFIVAIIAFSIFSPVIVLVALLLAIANNGKPFFFQTRPGRHARLFKVIKFKTMNDKKDAAGNLLPDADRLTLIGKIVRKTSLDELPQLLNVIKGDMSLVGPRPLLPEYLPLYNETESRRHEVRPGITGWAQINGRNTISWKQKFAYDIWYVDNLSFLLDIKIIWGPIAKVVKSEGINAQEAGTVQTQVTMEKFNGTN